MSARFHCAGRSAGTLASLGFIVAMGLTAGQAAPTPEEECLNNQKIIIGALWAYSLENKIPLDHTVLVANLAGYFKDNRVPACPLGGTYPAVLAVTREALDVEKTPICSLGGPEEHLQRASERLEPAPVQRARWLAVAVAVVFLLTLLLAWRRRPARTEEPPSEAG